MGLNREVEIVEFRSEFSRAFAELNYRWIEQLFEVEPHDRETLDDPEGSVMADGGMVFFALVDGVPAGTVALIRDADRFELAKMAVAPEHQGLGIGDALMAAAIEFGKARNARSLFLLSNTSLTPAINLYRKHGFREIPVDPDLPYQRVDIVMERGF